MKKMLYTVTLSIIVGACLIIHQTQIAQNTHDTESLTAEEKSAKEAISTDTLKQDIPKKTTIPRLHPSGSTGITRARLEVRKEDETDSTTSPRLDETGDPSAIPIKSSSITTPSGVTTTVTKHALKVEPYTNEQKRIDKRMQRALYNELEKTDDGIHPNAGINVEKNENVVKDPLFEPELTEEIRKEEELSLTE